MEDHLIFIIGAFISLLLFGGLFFTIIEFRKMNRYPEKYETPK